MRIGLAGTAGPAPELVVHLAWALAPRAARGAQRPDLLAIAQAAERGGADVLVVDLHAAGIALPWEEFEALCKELAVPVQIERALEGDSAPWVGPIRHAEICLNARMLRADDGEHESLDAARDAPRIDAFLEPYRQCNVPVWLGLHCTVRQIEAAARFRLAGLVLDAPWEPAASGRAQGADTAALHEAPLDVQSASSLALGMGLVVAARARSDAQAVALAKLPDIARVHVGLALHTRALAVGLEQAVRECKAALRSARLEALGLRR